LSVHFKPMHMHSYFKKKYGDEVCYPIAERVYSRFVTLPLYPRMTDEDVDDVIEAVKKCLGENND